MCWHSDWPFIGLEQNGDGIGEPVTEWDCPKGEAGPGLQIGDSFTNGKPGLQWQWQANPQPEAWLRPVAGMHCIWSAGPAEVCGGSPMCSVRCCLQRIYRKRYPWPGRVQAPELK